MTQDRKVTPEEAQAVRIELLAERVAWLEDRLDELLTLYAQDHGLESLEVLPESFRRTLGLVPDPDPNKQN